MSVVTEPRPAGSPARRKAGAKHKQTLLLSVETASRLSYHAKRRGCRESALAESILAGYFSRLSAPDSLEDRQPLPAK